MTEVLLSSAAKAGPAVDELEQPWLNGLASEPAPPAATNPPMPGVALCTIGYQMRSTEELIAELQAADVGVLVDVRETPWSNRREYMKSRLQAALEQHGIGYVHARFAGNPKELRRSAATHADCLAAYDDHVRASPAVLEQLDALITDSLAAGQRLCFFCYERHPHDCHRSILLQRWSQATGTDVVVGHLGTDGAPRFT